MGAASEDGGLHSNERDGDLLLRRVPFEGLYVGVWTGVKALRCSAERRGRCASSIGVCGRGASYDARTMTCGACRRNPSVEIEFAGLRRRDVPAGEAVLNVAEDVREFSDGED